MLQIFLNFLKQAAYGELCTSHSHYVTPGLALAAARLGSQLGLAWAPPSPAQGAGIADCSVAYAV